MRNECNIIKDLLPLYVEDIASEDTKNYVEEHLERCSDCSEEAQGMKKPENFIGDSSLPLKKLKKNLIIKRRYTIAFTVILVLIVTLSVLSFMTAPKFLPYSNNMCSIQSDEDGTLTISFEKKIANVECTELQQDESGKKIYSIKAWETLWDRYIHNNMVKKIIIKPETDNYEIYYTQNNSEEDIVLYNPNRLSVLTDNNIFSSNDSQYAGIINTETSEGVITLPRLVFGYYLIIAFIAQILFLLIFLIFRKKKAARNWIGKIVFLPVSYFISHLLIKGLNIMSYSGIRDFTLIFVMTVLVFVAFILASHMFNNKKKEN